MATQPDLYVIDGWHYPVPVATTIAVSQVLTALLKSGGGKIPVELTTPAQEYDFAGACTIPLAERDVEPALHFPHRIFMARSRLRREYDKFFAWCVANDWVEAPPEYLAARAAAEAEAAKPIPKPEKKPEKKTKPKPDTPAHQTTA